MHLQEIFTYYLLQLKSHWVLKAIYGTLAGIFAFLFDLELKLLLESLFILMMIDLISAGYAAYKRGAFDWRKVKKTVPKILIYFGMIAAARLLEVSLSQTVPFIDNSVIGFFAWHEFLSIMKHAGDLGYSTPRNLIEKLSPKINETYG